MSENSGIYGAAQAAATQIIGRLPQGWRPTVGLILGSGLGSLADHIQTVEVLPYNEIRNFPESTVQGHAGRLVLGDLEGCRVAAMQGRIHFYEGYSMEQVTFPVRVMYALGCEVLIVSNAAGGVNPAFEAGDLMLITDHIFLPGMAGYHPLRGAHDERLGVRFLEMKNAYDRQLGLLAHAAARAQNFTLREGVYCMLAGPTYETQAELRMVRGWGADAVGMSTVPEVIVARQAGMRVLGISTITNQTLSQDQIAIETSHEEVIAAGRQIGPRFEEIIRAVLRGMDSGVNPAQKGMTG